MAQSTSQSRFDVRSTISVEKRKEMQAAIARLMEQSKGLAGNNYLPDPTGYITALEKSPLVVEKETNWELFLRRDGGNVDAAAIRLFTYWARRLTVFGPDRAYLPLDKALLPVDKDLLRAAPMVKMECDSEGRDVYCVDLSRRVAGFAGGAEEAARSRLRAHFWNSTLAAVNPKSQTQGIVIIMPLTENHSLQLPAAKKFQDLFHNVFPFKVHSVHLACVPSPGTKGLFKHTLIPTYERAFTDWSETKSLYSHIGKSPEHLLVKLSKAGLGKNTVPETLGGSWKYESWYEMLDQIFCPRRVIKKKSAKGPLKKRLMQAAHGEKEPPSKVPRTVTNQTASALVSNAVEQDQEGQKPAYLKTQASAQDQEKSSSRQQVAVESLCTVPIHKEITGGYSQETLLNFTRVMSANPGRCADQKIKNEDEKAAFLKKRDALYSRRKYYKKKLKFEGLMINKQKFTVENEALKKENRRLTFLVKEAQRIELEEDQKLSRLSASLGGTSARGAVASLAKSNVSHVHMPLPATNPNLGNSFLQKLLQELACGNNQSTAPSLRVSSGVAGRLPSSGSEPQARSISQFLHQRKLSGTSPDEHAVQVLQNQMNDQVTGVLGHSQVQIANRTPPKEEALFREFFPSLPQGSGSTLSQQQQVLAQACARQPPCGQNLIQQAVQQHPPKNFLQNLPAALLARSNPSAVLPASRGTSDLQSLLVGLLAQSNPPGPSRLELLLRQQQQQQLAAPPCSDQEILLELVRRGRL